MSHPHPELPPPPPLADGALRIYALGGLREIGRNMTVFEFDGKLLIVDCGVLFPEEHQPGVDLTDATAVLTLTGPGYSLELTTANGGLQVLGVGRLLIVLTPAQSAAIPLDGVTYTLDITWSNGEWSGGGLADSAFSFTIGAIPEPRSLGLILAGGLLLFAWKRKLGSLRHS